MQNEKCKMKNELKSHHLNKTLLINLEFSVKY